MNFQKYFTSTFWKVLCSLQSVVHSQEYPQWMPLGSLNLVPTDWCLLGLDWLAHKSAQGQYCCSGHNPQHCETLLRWPIACFGLFVCVLQHLTCESGSLWPSSSKQQHSQTFFYIRNFSFTHPNTPPST